MDTPEDRAATKIQAEIRGFLARKHVEKMKKEDNQAATKIQAHIRAIKGMNDMNSDLWG
ncbi:hypothetical protein ANCDUO_07391 [Ancylostoma duodenale]|uniref:Uncharacterized protein n=1 Tax=Ancylostoma duodenale TaxID=51022 RepID=A0A0C2DIL5_9BILA|nr:hypothetical protein ANCDUO_07391 [Ancylostoma duodenale]